MAEAVVRGVHVNYEVIGASGPWIALTPGSRRSYAELRRPVERQSRPPAIACCCTTGAIAARPMSPSTARAPSTRSGPMISTNSARQLGALPMFVGGSSAGARLAILYALRHAEGAARPAVVAAHRRTGGGRSPGRELLRQIHQDRARGRHAGGVREFEHFAECIKARPDNRERLTRDECRSSSSR